ncbi:N-acetyl-1-D-myo-inositol-2-amino-2-deoxy-alpha-D-glucopyranoside deacetylase [Actinoplanes sp. NPDC049265]|uniref:N-acetyl-1-D-myo-inositol-2-amino-2-deoxy-alpha- D-glucopyranoside deacetylase n=1 Tax=Actinoplanes sp. NPDC049265 TaxID=3363902 RepID=UPI00371D140C
MTAERRLMMVHAHPDDESSSTGATLARYVAEGAQVTLVTCTLGEEGEIHVPALAQLAAGQADQLGGVRLGEWERACAELGLTDRRFLGGAGHYRDSGMMGEESNKHPRAFWQADLEEAAQLCLEVMREVRPQVLVTYDDNGLYGHPDHIQAHRVAMRAAELAGEEGFGPERIYWTAMSHSYLQRTLEEFRGSPGNAFEGIERAEDLPFGLPDDKIDVHIAGTTYVARKRAALAAYPTQIPPNSPFVASEAGDWLAAEHFVLAHGAKTWDGWADDLFRS